jgi:ATP synthase F1 delta subunit
MKITEKQYAASLYQSVKDKNKKEADVVIENFVKILIANNDVCKLNQIIEQFEKVWNKEEGIVEAEVISAKRLDNKIVKLLNGYIAKLSGAKKVETAERVDKNILGGVVIKYGDKILDGSLRTRLEDLKSQMTK